MITTLPYSTDPNLGLRCSEIQTTGDLAFSQLGELRHRGAFCTVSQTFSSCCKRCTEAGQQDFQDLQAEGLPRRKLPRKWYQVGQIS